MCCAVQYKQKTLNALFISTPSSISILCFVALFPFSALPHLSAFLLSEKRQKRRSEDGEEAVGEEQSRREDTWRGGGSFTIEYWVYAGFVFVFFSVCVLFLSTAAINSASWIEDKWFLLTLENKCVCMYLCHSFMVPFSGWIFCVGRYTDLWLVNVLYWVLFMKTGLQVNGE